MSIISESYLVLIYSVLLSLLLSSCGTSKGLRYTKPGEKASQGPTLNSTPTESYEKNSPIPVESSEKPDTIITEHVSSCFLSELPTLTLTNSQNGSIPLGQQAIWKLTLPQACAGKFRLSRTGEVPVEFTDSVFFITSSSTVGAKLDTAEVEALNRYTSGPQKVTVQATVNFVAAPVSLSCVARAPINVVDVLVDNQGNIIQAPLVSFDITSNIPSRMTGVNYLSTNNSLQNLSVTFPTPSNNTHHLVATLFAKSQAVFTFQIVDTNNSASTATCAATIDVRVITPAPPLPTLSLTVNGFTSDQVLTANSNVSVTWSSAGVLACNDPFGGTDFSGTRNFSALNTDTTYTLNCISGYGTVSKSIKISLPNCTSTEAIVDAAAVSPEYNGYNTPGSFIYDHYNALRGQGYPLAVWDNPWDSDGTGSALFNNSSSLLAMCQLVGYANGYAIESYVNTKPDDNAVLKWNLNTKRFELLRASLSGNNNMVKRFKCTKKLSDRCSNSLSWMF